jgi:DNA-binding transcriptional ArsR family regulator
VQQPQQFDRLFHALADPHRRGMVERLSRGPASVKDLAIPRQLALPSALKHLRVLEEGGLVASDKVGRVRTFRMRADALSPLAEWVRDRQATLERAFDRLAEVMADHPEERSE